MAIFDEKIEIGERCKGVHCVDLGESFPTSIYVQKSASIQPRTSPSKFGGKFNSVFTSLLSLARRDAGGEHPQDRRGLRGAEAPLERCAKEVLPNRTLLHPQPQLEPGSTALIPNKNLKLSL